MDKTLKHNIEESVPTGIVKQLQSEVGGINPIIDELRQVHMLDVSYDGNSLILKGNNNDIIDMTNEYLEEKIGRKPSQRRKTLGGKGTVVWTYKEPFCTQTKGLFENELKEILKINTVEQLTDSDKGLFKLSCKYSVYETVKQKIEDLEKKVENCRSLQKSVTAKDVQRARQFVQNETCCCQLVQDRTDKRKYELYFYGKDEKSCKIALQSWGNISEQKGSSKKEKESHNDSSTTGHTQSSEQKETKKREEGTQKGNKTPEMSKSFSQTQGPTVMDVEWENQPPTDVTQKHVPDLSKPQMEKSTKRNVDSSELSQTTVNKTTMQLSTSTASIGQIGIHQAGISSTNILREYGKFTGSGGKAKYSCIIGEIHVHVYKESITDIKGMDAITNAANERLMHGGGVAFYISKAAGRRMDQDCKTYIEKNGLLSVTQNYVSIPGEMKCKGIIHAVGPTWWDYRGIQDKCAEDLYKTIKNVLKEVQGKGWRKVALSAISSGLFGVPKKLCAEMYVKAFADFAGEGPGSLKEVHFIDVSREILDIVIDAHKDWVKAPESLSFQNAFDYPLSRNGNEQTSKRQDSRVVGEKTMSGSKIKFEGEGRTSYGERMFKYSVNDKMKLLVYNGSLTRLEIDAIGFPIGTTGHGGMLATSVKSLAGSSYISSLTKQMKENKASVIVSKDTGRLKCRNIVHVIAPVMEIFDMSDKSLQAITNVYRLALTHAYSGKIKKLAMPLIGIGLCYGEYDKQRLCQAVVATVAGVCEDQISEFHIVNNHPLSTSYIQNELKTFTLSKYNKSSSFAVSKRQVNRTDKSGQVRRGVDMDGWTRHEPLKDLPIKEEETSASVGKKTSLVKNATKNSKCVYCPKKNAEKLLSCGHTFCVVCFIPIEESEICPKCVSTSRDSKKSASVLTNCPVCLEDTESPHELPCDHKLCLTCFNTLKMKKPECPICKHIFGIIRGNQPPGYMFYRFLESEKLPGYEQVGVIEIYYDIPDGKQQEDHSNPGAPFRGTQRFAFLPDNASGREVLVLLRRAFDRKLIFTVGDSRTTGKEGVVTWNDIHHKTKPDGGSEKFGYPDPTYLTRVKEELAAKGVTA